MFFVSVPIKTLTDKDSEWYNLSGGKKLAIIFNHEYFKNGMGQRRGTDKDCQAIKNTFEKLGFQVQQHDDLTVIVRINPLILYNQSIKKPFFPCSLF